MQFGMMRILADGHKGTRNKFSLLRGTAHLGCRHLSMLNGKAGRGGSHGSCTEYNIRP